MKRRSCGAIFPCFFSPAGEHVITFNSDYYNQSVFQNQPFKRKNPLTMPTAKGITIIYDTYSKALRKFPRAFTLIGAHKEKLYPNPSVAAWSEPDDSLVTGRIIRTYPFGHPFFKRFFTRLTDGLNAFALSPQRQTLNSSKVPYTCSLSNRPLSRQHIPGRRFRHPPHHPKKACTPRPDPKSISLVIDRLLHCVLPVPQSIFSENIPLFYLYCIPNGK